MAKKYNYISNPCRWFITGGAEEEFTYGTSNMPVGKYLWHFCISLQPGQENENWVGINLVWFADTRQEAIQRLKAMIELRIKCGNKYIKYHDKLKSTHSADFIDSTNHMGKYCTLILNLIEADTIIVTKAPTNQFFKVAWASNDIVLG